MKIDEIRPSFTVYVISRGSLDGIADTLEYAGYLTATYEDVESAFADVTTNPPHVVVHEVDQDEAEDVERFIQRVHNQLPETHVILLAPYARRARFVDLLESGAYDIIYAPLVAPVELLRAVDRAAERDYFMYVNERAQAETPPEPARTPAPAIPNVPSGAHAEFARDIFRRRTVDECVDAFLRHVGPGVYFRYVANRRVLLASAKHQVDAEIGGLGLNLNEITAGFRSGQLHEPNEIPAFREMVLDVFGTATFVTRTLEVAGEVLGVFVFPAWTDQTTPPDLDDLLLLLDRAIGLLDAEKRLHVLNVRDDQTDVLARPHFVTRLTQEISRARRLNLPVSLLIMAFDQYDLVGSDVGTEEAQTMLRTIARLCERYSRVNDVIGRVGTGELGLLLPHTSRRGALIKAERLRRALAQADFGKVLRTHPRVTVSIGVSEYPTLVRDADELINSADETLYHIRGRGNRVAVAEPPTNFTPDFAVADQAP